MDGKCVCEFEGRIAFFTKITAVKIVGVALLRREFYFQNLRFPTGLPKAYGHSDFAVRQIADRAFLRVNLLSIANVIAEVNYLVAVNYALRAHRFGNRTPPWFACC